MKYTKLFPSLIVAVVFAPNISFAALDGVNSLLKAFGKLVGAAIPIAFGLGVLFFFWGVAKFILAAGNPTAKSQGKDIMVWGVIALFVMASVWGLVAFLGSALGIDVPVRSGSQPNQSSIDPCEGIGDGCE